MTKISADDVRKLARLSRLRLEDGEVQVYQKELEAILGYVEQLQDVKLDGLEPTNQVTGLENVTRTDDVIDYHITPEKLLAVAPRVKDNQYQVERMIA